MIECMTARTNRKTNRTVYRVIYSSGYKRTYVNTDAWTRSMIEFYTADDTVKTEEKYIEATDSVFERYEKRKEYETMKTQNKTQETINNTARLIYDRIKQRDAVYTPSWTQFGSKQCWVSEPYYNRYFVVKSYNTIVAIIDDQQGELYELNKYSRTTSKQITQLYNLPDWESYRTFGFSKLEHRYLCTNNITAW